MATEISSSWFKDKNGNPFAPKTLIEAVENTKGEKLEDLLKQGGGSPATYDPETETIKLGSGGSGGSNHQYSTDEQVIGTWIDGKPIYEKVIVLSNNFTGDEIIDSEISYNFLIFSEIIAIKTSGKITRAINGMINNTLNDGMTVYIENNALCALVGSSWNDCLYKCVIIQYTKTTD